MASFYSVLANVLVALHVAYVSFVVLGLLAILLGTAFRWGWVRNRWFRILHLIATAIPATETVIHVTCPLTTWENTLRELAGQTTLEGDFIANILRGLIFLPLPDDHWLFTVAYIGFGVVVLATLFLIPPRWHRRGHSDSQTPTRPDAAQRNSSRAAAGAGRTKTPS